MAGSEYYDHTTYPSNGASGSASAMRSELNNIELGFDKAVPLAGNANKLVKVNSGAAAQTTSIISDDGATATVAGALTATGALTGASLAVTTPVPVTQGGTGRATGTTAYGLIAAGTTATGAQQTLPAGATTEILIGGGTSALPVWTTATGTGAPVRDTSSTLVTPLLGTPTSGTLTNCTGLPAGGLTATATDKLFGRSTAGAGVGEEITCTAAGRALLDDADAAAQLVTLGAAALAGSASQAFSAGKLTVSGTTSGISITNANSTEAYQANIAGSMTFNSASLYAQAISTTITGGASTTAMRGLLLNTTFTPTANPAIQNILNQFTLDSGSSPASVYGINGIFTLGASALGGTIANFYGNAVGFTPNAAATTPITTWTSYHASNIADGTAMAVGTAYSFLSAMNSAAGTRWGFYHGGTANNAFNGNCRFGGVTAPTVAVDVTGAILATTTILSSGATSGIGYTTGAGGSVTQLTSITTAVTLNKICGRISCYAGTYNANTQYEFTVNNTAAAGNDFIAINENGSNKGLVITANSGTNAFIVVIRNVTAANITPAGGLALNFGILKVVAS